MNCDRVSEILDDYFDASVSVELAMDIEAHVCSCPECAKAVAQHRTYQSAIRSIEVPSLSSGEAAHLLRKAKGMAAEQSNLRAHRTSFYQGFAAAVFVCAVFFFAWNAKPVIFPELVEAPTEEFVAATPALHEVHVVIYVPADMPNSQLALEVPDYMAIDGYDDLRTISWTTDLNEGANQLVLPVYVKPGTDLNRQHMIAATIGYKNKARTFQLKVDLNAVRNSDRDASVLSAKPNQSV